LNAFKLLFEGGFGWHDNTRVVDLCVHKRRGI
jgi:hypothetical protein